MHAAGHQSSHGDAIWIAVSHLAWPSDFSDGKASSRRTVQGQGRSRKVQYPASARRRKEAGRHWIIPARTPRRANTRTVGSLHGNQRQGVGFLFDLALLLG